MSVHRTITHAGMLLLVVLSMLTIHTGMADASAVVELITSFGDEAPGGIAVDLETGNVYVTDKRHRAIDVSWS